jgi:hypothetical protein
MPDTLYDKVLEAYVGKLLEQKLISLGGKRVRIDGKPDPQQLRLITSSYRSGVQFAVKKLYPIYRRSWDGKESQQKFAAAMKPVDVGFRKDGWEIYFETDKFEDHSIVVRFDQRGKPVDAHI